MESPCKEKHYNLAMGSFPQNSRTFQILDDAAERGYSVGACNWFVVLLHWLWESTNAVIHAVTMMTT